MSITQDLLDWYDTHARDLPWRVGPHDRAQGIVPDPYHVWLSEIMLQQTTVAAVKPYFAHFTQRWPTVMDLAQASDDEIKAAWAGLGYYRRAANLMRCARKVSEDGGGFPSTAAGLKALPGIGDYTSAAIASIAFDEPAPVVDGNVERVMTRVYDIATPLPAAKVEVKQKVAELVPEHGPGDFAQAMMDLGATICTPRKPACMACPLSEVCQARRLGNQLERPVKAPKKAVPTRKGIAHVYLREGDEAVLLRSRPEKGLLAGMREVPSSQWSARKDDETLEPLVAGDLRSQHAVEHVFTHARLQLAVHAYQVPDDQDAPDGCQWVLPEALGQEALPTLFVKAIVAVRPDWADQI